jgi:hypothetical protein
MGKKSLKFMAQTDEYNIRFKVTFVFTIILEIEKYDVAYVQENR